MTVKNTEYHGVQNCSLEIIFPQNLQSILPWSSGFDVSVEKAYTILVPKVLDVTYSSSPKALRLFFLSAILQNTDLKCHGVALFA